MSVLISNCPRCGTKQITFDLISDIVITERNVAYPMFEAFCICRACKKSSIFLLISNKYNAFQNIKYGEKKNILSQLDSSVNSFVKILRHISQRDESVQQPPEHLPERIKEVFREGATCAANDCYNAAGTIFRLCVDLATREMLPEGKEDSLNEKTRRDLGLRLPWLFKNNILPESLRELSLCIKDSGNDGAHQGTLGKNEIEDIKDFTYILLERLYTEPQKVKMAQERRTERRKKDSASNG